MLPGSPAFDPIYHELRRVGVGTGGVENRVDESEVRQMPQFRFTVRGMMLAVALVASVTGFLATYRERLGCGHASVPLMFQIVDSGDEQPVVGAKVELFNISGDPPTVIMTG